VRCSPGRTDSPGRTGLGRTGLGRTDSLGRTVYLSVCLLMYVGFNK